MTTLNPGQQRNYIVLEHSYNEQGEISPRIKTLQNGLLHILRPDRSILRNTMIELDFSDLMLNAKKTYLFADHQYDIDIRFADNVTILSRGEFRSTNNERLLLDVLNINNCIYVEGKNYS